MRAKRTQGFRWSEKLAKGYGLWYTILVSEKHFTQNNIKTEEFKMTGERFRKVFKPIRKHGLPKIVRTKLYWFLYDTLVKEEI